MRDCDQTAPLLAFPWAEVWYTPASRTEAGPVAQWLEPTAHNRLVAGSSPAGPTSSFVTPARRLLFHYVSVPPHWGRTAQMLTRSSTADIVSDVMASDLVVCGFFTPDYRQLAAALADDLAPYHAFHLFAVSKDNDSWVSVVQRKPKIVLQAMELYPKTTIVLLDVDCSVRGPIDAMTDVPGDVSAYVKLKQIRRLLSPREQTLVHVSSRSMVFKPNERARKFLSDWDTEIRTAKYHQGGCERALRMTLFRATYLAFSPMDERYSGREITVASDEDVIVHDSASRGKR